MVGKATRSGRRTRAREQAAAELPGAWLDAAVRARMADPTIERPWELTEEEGRRLFAEETRYYFNMSPDEFIRAWYAGDLGDVDSRPHLLHVVMSLPFVGLDPWRERPNAG